LLVDLAVLPDDEGDVPRSARRTRRPWRRLGAEGVRHHGQPRRGGGGEKEPPAIEASGRGRRSGHGFLPGSCAPERRVAVPDARGPPREPDWTRCAQYRWAGLSPAIPGDPRCLRATGLRDKVAVASGRTFLFPQEEGVNDAQELTSRGGIDVA